MQNKDLKGHFVIGNKIGNRFKPGESNNPEGRPKGSKNLMTVVRDLANGKAVGKRKKLTRFAKIVISAMETNDKLETAVSKLETDDPGYRKALEGYQKSCTDLSEFLLKSSGDFSTTIKSPDDEGQREFSSVVFSNNGEQVIVLK